MKTRTCKITKYGLFAVIKHNIGMRNTPQFFFNSNKTRFIESFNYAFRVIVEKFTNSSFFFFSNVLGKHSGTRSRTIRHDVAIRVHG